MTVIKLTNTKTRKKEVFTPIDADNVRMYVCGPTVYDRAHIGNARPVIVFDVLYRLLRHVYGADHVTYVRNFTDVDDKINARAEASGRSIREITDETTQWYLDDMRAVGAMDPNEMPRATEYIPQMIAMIETLIAKGHAYSDGAGHVLFSVNSYEKYGALSGRSVDDMIAGARVEVADNKRDPMDFVLWKPSSEDQPGWDSPWGYGRPGWHIECSAMSYDLLGESFDIHGGGNDLMFPHHENEIAQSCCAHGHEHDGAGFATYWLHNEMLQVEGKKMSKSLGNFFTVRDLLDGHDGMPGVPGEVIRFVFLSTHYRKPMDWTAARARIAEIQLTNWAQVIRAHPWAIAEKNLNPDEFSQSWVPVDVLAAISDDLNTSLAISRLVALSKPVLPGSGFFEPDSEEASNIRGLLAGCDILGIDLVKYLERIRLKEQELQGDGRLSKLADHLFALRQAAMENKDFSAVDEMKKALLDAGVEVKMSKTSVVLEKRNVDPIATAFARANNARDDIDEMNFWLDIAEQMQRGQVVCKENQEDKINQIAEAYIK
ncbi:cysteine--tRNA ligase [Celeribacter baekdonensis]|uniref:cysteine--tRNA ligase n=1 Tax=Celeribacter baekdonensis TaxID=875171 RepID=UPI0030D7AB55|tara:strand:- start:224200 stop:225834 length:1635 start_codon:yes stop_codon:yes gene_type:complete